jgi:hypothetical protein
MIDKIKKYFKNKKIEDELIKQKMAELSPLINKHKFCPLSGKPLQWRFIVSWSEKYDSVTGEYLGTPVVHVLRAQTESSHPCVRHFHMIYDKEIIISYFGLDCTRYILK